MVWMLVAIAIVDLLLLIMAKKGTPDIAAGYSNTRGNPSPTPFFVFAPNMQLNSGNPLF